ncbi:hypothetical protein [Burkholderia lata]|uniref:hypothetical protein n=1 Tax=Burkholderia lata (strain ATCC 17760 / DSM 23089 / LMG 22485 / NCIMB 9086 / R18194 / 383) TaxID=482957 RepID=UPI001581807D|nr:hypothetical protein [Burkholderia lata]
MSAELSGMVYDAPMTGNQSFIDKNEMNNCDERTLKYYRNLPLTSCHKASIGTTARPENPEYGYLYFYLFNPRINRNRAFVKRLRIIDEFSRIRDFLLPASDSTDG